MAITFGNFTENVSLPLDTQYLVGYDTTVSGGERRTTLAILKQAFYLNGVTSDIQTQLNSKQVSFGFTPVQQGGGTGQGTNKVYVGWLGGTLGLQVDTNNYSNVWPISITGNAATATTAGTCTGNAATATTAGTCTGNAATATTAGTCTGNAATATKLQTPVTINGVSFDGSTNISLPTGGGSVTSVTASSPLTVANGTTTPAITLGVIPPSLGGAGGLTGVLKASSGTVSVATAGTDYVIPSGSISGNAATATTATTAGTAGTCTGNAATATKLQNARTIVLTGSVTGSASFDGSANISIATTGGGAITLATAQTATGTAVDFTGIPSWVKRITVMFDGISNNGGSSIQIQFGTSSSFESTGYVSGNAFGSIASGFVLGVNPGAGYLQYGTHVFTLLSGNTWIQNGNSLAAGIAVQPTCGSKTLASTLTRVRLTTVNGTDQFDAGTINISYEG